MNVLLDSSTVLGGKDGDKQEMTTKLISPQDETDETDVSRIPKKYHIVKTFPIFPKDYADQGYRCYSKDGVWNVVLWPSANPDSRQDIQFLSDAVRLMLDEIQGDSATKIDPNQITDVQKAKSNASHMMQLFDKRSTLLKIALDEITRQVSAHCTERGALLSFLIEDLMSAFKEIPKQYNVALKILKKEVDQLRVALDAKNLELDSQAKDLNEQISLMMLERRMEKEWHAQLDEQLKKWRTQIDSYKKKAQDQIRLEREMLEHQISGLRDVVADLRLENDALKEQLQFQRTEMLKSEKRFAEFEVQIQTMNKKNEKLQMQISKGGSVSGRAKTPTIDETNAENGESKPPGPEAELVEGSKLKELLNEFPPKKEMPLLTQKEITQTMFGLFDSMFLNQNDITSFDDYYAKRIIVTEETPQGAADTARGLLQSLIHSQEVFQLAQISNNFLRRKFSDSVLKIFIQFWGFFKAQPFQGNLMLDPATDVPSIPVALSNNLTSAMFNSIIGEQNVQEVNEAVKAVQIEERGHEPMISIVTVFSLLLDKIVDFYNKKYTDVMNNFTRTYSRFQRTILAKIPNADSSVPRMDWRTFRDFMKPLRTELTTNDLERVFFDGVQFSDSIASITSDAFDTLCVSRQVYINKVRTPGSGKRLRYVPPDMLSVIESAWKGSLRAAVKKAITELSKSDQSQAAVTTLRSLDQRLEDTLKNPQAGPFCVQLLHEAATIIATEAVSIASSLPIDKCLTIMERQLTVLNTDAK